MGMLWFLEESGTLQLSLPLRGLLEQAKCYRWWSPSISGLFGGVGMRSWWGSGFGSTQCPTYIVSRWHGEKRLNSGRTQSTVCVYLGNMGLSYRVIFNGSVGGVWIVSLPSVLYFWFFRPTQTAYEGDTGQKQRILSYHTIRLLQLNGVVCSHLFIITDSVLLSLYTLASRFTVVKRQQPRQTLIEKLP